jgi:hypothetical protein
MPPTPYPHPLRIIEGVTWQYLTDGSNFRRPPAEVAPYAFCARNFLVKIPSWPPPLRKKKEEGEKEKKKERKGLKTVS